MPPAGQPALLDLVEAVLAEQGCLQTPAARASIAHGQYAAGLRASALSRQLIPLTAPAPGEHYAFEVDLDSCSGCKACVAGCHSLNGLDDEETWRDTGLLLGGDHRQPFQQTVTTACHHCADPACLNGCPVLAYEKDPVTGIVRHLDDQCIGCSYCILKCPYDVPKYSERLGIVRKCDMCHQRLAAGEAPACVQACPTHAISIVTVKVTTQTNEPAAAPTRTLSPNLAPPPAPTDESLIPRYQTFVTGQPVALQPFLPGAADPSYTLPTTRFVSSRPVPANARAADQNTLRPQPPHWPLIIMLVCTQVAVGLQLARWFLPAGERPDATYYMISSPAPLVLVALAFAAIGLASSIAHLGQPRRAWRIFLGVRRSWLSREAIVFGAWFPALVLSSVWPSPTLAAVATVLGLAGVLCSVMIYVDTRRRAWQLGPSLARFFGTVAVSSLVTLVAWSPSAGHVVVLAIALTGKLLLEGRAWRPLAEHDSDADLVPALATARLQTGRFRPVLSLRLACAVVALVVLPALTDEAREPVRFWAAAGLGTLLLLGELAERYLYFRTVDAPKMPGYAGRRPTR